MFQNISSGLFHALLGAAFLSFLSPSLSASAADLTGPAFDPALKGSLSSETIVIPEALSYDLQAFVLPEDAQLFLVTEAISSVCRVTVYSREPGGSFRKELSVPGVLGENGLSDHRTAGDRTTPVGLFCMNTPFGQAPAQEGFPSDYMQVSSSYVWSDLTNTLEDDPNLLLPGERVGTERYAGYYDYVLDMGYNKKAIADKGGALFLHCNQNGDSSTSGCVAIDPAAMLQIMKLYGRYGTGHCYIALAPYGGFGPVYDSFGSNDGLSPQ